MTGFEVTPGVAPQGDAFAFPLSFAQERLWFLDRFQPGSSAYNIPLAMRLTGKLDEQALEEALNGVVARHEGLRTSFCEEGGDPFQVVHAELRVQLSVVDLTSVPTASREQEADRLILNEALEPFDLATAPLLRASLFRLAQDDHIFLLTVHHIVADGWSTGIVFRELAELYRARVTVGAPALPELSLQYGDFAAWQREWLEGERLEEQIEYWRRQLDGAPTVLELPSDRPRPPVQSDRGAHLGTLISNSLLERLKTLSQEEGATLFMTLLAAFDTLLARYTGQDDIVVGTPIANRTRVELESIVGFFTNTLVLRTSTDGNPTFRELIALVRELTLDAHAHQDLPFEKLVAELNPDRALSHSPLFQVMFALQNTGRGQIELPGLTLSRMELERGTAKFDLGLFARELPTGLRLSFEYSTDLFDETTIERMAGHLETLLEGIVHDPSRPLSDLPLLDEAERRERIEQWSGDAVDYPVACLHELFEAKAAHNADAPAVAYEDEALTYRELDERANQLAHYLRALGVGAETLVGLCLERSLEMVVSILAVLKAGGAYVPLDPEYPTERLAFVLQDTEAPVLITQAHQLERLPRHGATVVCVDRDAHIIGRRPVAELEGVATPDSLAYVIYTSGSTGQPKGVQVEHRNVARLFAATDNWFHFGPSDTWLLFHSYAFDFSVWELWGALLHGGRLVVPPHWTTRSAQALASLLADEQITVFNTTPTLFVSALDDLVKARDELGVRLVVFGGEALQPHALRAWFELMPSDRVQLVNMYGITETTVHVTYRPISAQDIEVEASPIGIPIPDLQLYLLDQNLAPVPIGVAGELYVGGAGVARGYLKRPELTDERFLPNPFGQGRLYRSGDLARALPNGDLEFLGRLDNQVKVRGFRIELGEIESALCNHPSVSAAVVVKDEDRSGDARLVAYVLQPGEAVSAQELRRFTGETLPAYMVPAGVITLDAFPLTPNGKLDGERLPSASLEPSDETEYVAPRTPTEELLAALFAETLGIARVGVQSNFFSLGGHSLLAARVTARIPAAVGVDVPLAAIFVYPTVEGLARVVELARGGRAAAAPITPLSRDRPIPASFAQQRLWFLDRFQPGSSAYNIPLAMRLTGRLEKRALEEALNGVVARHEGLRTSFSEEGGDPFQVVYAELRVPLNVVDLTSVPTASREQEADRLILDEALEPFDLATAPLLRASLFRLAQDDHIFLLTVHHIVADGWSMGIVFRELADLYRGHLVGDAPALPELSLQYGDFAAWQREWLEGERLEEQIDYWRGQLDATPTVLELPGDRPRPPVQSDRGAHLGTLLPNSLLEQLRELSQNEGASLFMTLLAAFDMLLARYTGQDDIVVGTPIANRTRIELESVVGFFANTLVLRTSTVGNPTFRELIARVREVMLDAYAHQELPFEKLVAELNPDRALSHSPLFQIMFALQYTGNGRIELPGLTLSRMGLERGTAKFDLALFARELPTGLGLSCEYSTDLFDEDRIERLLRHFRTLLEGVVEEPDRRIGEIELLTRGERDLLARWNETAYTYPEAGRCVHELVEEQAQRSPGAVAATTGGKPLVYSELNTRANRLAWQLRELGVGPDVPVAIHMERSLELPVAVLAVLKAGGAYAPLDPAYPPERLRVMLEDTAAPVVLTQSRLLDRLPEHNALVICVDTEPVGPAGSADSNPPVLGTAEDLAYILFTSGSTGKPKGVAMPHRTLSNLLAWQRDHFASSPAARTLQFASMSFDVAFQELFSTWICGGTLILIDEETRRDPASLLSALAEQSVERLFVPYVALQHLAEAALELDTVPASLREVITAGEALQITPAIREFFGRLPGCTLQNQYGPTESHVVTAFALEGSPQTWPDRPPIGRPIANARIHLLDEHGNQVPVGVAGKLFIGGDVLARGYFRRRELTAERFVADPFCDRPGAQLYWTGDRARYLADGTIEFVGRTDHQVKIRGFRVEPGEIEAELASHPAVREALVLARDEQPGDRRLVAYVVADDAGSGKLERELKRFLSDALPGYMVPSAIVVLEAFPVSPNGKVDRSALPAPGSDRSDEGFVAPSSPTEEMVARVWSEVLTVEPIGASDDFFALGGHSLLATRVISRLRTAFNVEIGLQSIFEEPTVAGLAAVVDSRIETDQRAEGPVLTPVNRQQHRVTPAYSPNPGAPTGSTRS